MVGFFFVIFCVGGVAEREESVVLFSGGVGVCVRVDVGVLRGADGGVVEALVVDFMERGVFADIRTDVHVAPENQSER